MARLFRISYFFDEPKQGWSENWYFTRDELSLRAYLDEFNLSAQLRAKLLGRTAKLSHLRISQVQDNIPGVRTPRLSLGRDLNLDGNSQYNLAAPHDSLLINCVTGDGNVKKPVYLGGPWLSCFDELRHYQPVGNYATLLNDWAAEMKARGVGWLRQVLDNNLQITGYTFDPVTGRTTLNLTGPVTFAANVESRRATINFPGGHEALDGVLLVSPVAGQPNQVITTKPRPTHAFDGRIGKLKTYNYIFAALGPTPPGGQPSSFDAQRMARRNRGKSSYAELGRRAATVRY